MPFSPLAEFAKLKGDPNKVLTYLWNHFQLPNAVAKWTSDVSEVVETPFETLAKERSIPTDAIYVQSSKIYPTYIVKRTKKDQDGKDIPNSTQLVAVMWLNTFSPLASDEDTVNEVKQTIKMLQGFGVKSLVIDLINNGGGSLTLGTSLVQAFAKTRIETSEIQYKLSETWLDEFESMSLNSPSDWERELYKRVYLSLEDDWKQNKRLSKNFSIESLMPFALTPNTDLEEPLHIVLAVNEMCASMCDIFSAMMQDNHLATLIGEKTMGAGGNVVPHMSAPNSGFILQQTESLILRKDGTYIENNGVIPDVKLQINEFAGSNKYASAIDKAINLAIP